MTAPPIRPAGAPDPPGAPAGIVRPGVPGGQTAGVPSAPAAGPRARPPRGPAWPASHGRPAWPASYGLLLAFAAAATLTAVCVVSGAAGHPAAGLVPLAVVAALAAAATTPVAAPGIAVMTWMFDDGFLIGRRAVLVWHGSASGWPLAVLAAAALAGAAAGAWIRAGRPRRPAAGR